MLLEEASLIPVVICLTIQFCAESSMEIALKHAELVFRLNKWCRFVQFWSAYNYECYNFKCL